MLPAIRAVKFIIVPYRKGNGGTLQPAEMRQASNEASAIRIAESMAPGFAGIAAYEVVVDNETGAMDSPRVLMQQGAVPALDD
ncbi:hypothetical protein PTE30175_04089 [Pandoraea terrae]|uniref:Uncharacterized protein n=1 Tax=Pandoraea terrae TaxID=1537710 RepID=A0A5E4XZ42_9BURK|nr:hypothetical protein [Pandoraea terrae]VVE41610.1 hypothetical protein PTE30175_04089 [Pandoraea terrae]